MPDVRVELRMIVTTAEAASVSVMFSPTPVAPDSEWIAFADALRTAHDEDYATPLPPGFVTYHRHSGRIHQGIAVNATTGEVVFWAVDR